MSKDNYKVYVHINKANGKRYFGITKQKVENRWNSGKGYQRHEHFWNSICKYGWDNFEHIVIARGLTEEEAKWLEIELIREHDTTNQNKGYNISLGGECGNFTEETRKKIGEAMKGKNNHRAKQVYCVELEQYFDTITEASEYVSCNENNIRKVLSSNRKTCGGYHWLRAEDVNEENINKVLSLKTGKATKVYCVELDKYFETVTEASEYVGCDKSNLSKVLGKNNRTASGYHWLYAEDVEIENNKVS